MLISYLKTAWRNLARNKLVSFINVFGLALSMSVGLMIMIRVQDSLGYDTFHPAAGRIYRVTSDFKKTGGDQWHMASTPLPLTAELSRNTEAIEAAVNIYPVLNGTASAAGKEIYLSGVFTEPAFFDIFGFSLAAGNPVTALQQPNSIVITNIMAQKFFGSVNPLGKMIKMADGTIFLVTGVMNEPPGKTQFAYDAYASYSSVAQLEKDEILPKRSGNWYAFNTAYTYIKVKKDVQSSAIQSKLNAIALRLNREYKEGTTAFHLQPLSEMSPGSDHLDNDTAKGTTWSKIYVEAGMALLILLAACFNYTSLTIARALTRSKEVGIRKISGAKRYQIFEQYILEAIVLSLLSLALAQVILSFILRYAPFNDDYEFIPSSFRYNTAFFIFSIGYAIFAGLLAGSSPAWILSAFTPLRVLKNLQTAKIFGRISLQKSLITFQYTLSLVIIIFLFAFHRQFSFMSKADPGFVRDHVMIVPIYGLDEQIATQKVLNVSGVSSAGAFSGKFSRRFSGMNTQAWTNNKNNATGLNYYYANRDFISSMALDFAAGKNFAASSSDSGQYMLLNEKAAQVLGFEDPYKAVGQKIWVNDSTQLEVSGVLKDFHYEAAGRSISPLAIRSKAHAYNYLYIKTAAGEKKPLERRIAAVLSALQPGQSFTASWLDDELDTANSQTATISLLGFLGFIALSVATLGLLGLVIYTVQVKAKEISIRKVIGATEKQLVEILSGGFVRLLVLSGLIAMPIGGLLAHFFLQNFSSRVSFSAGDILLCFLFQFSIGMVTIITQTYRASVSNPAVNLRTE